ncbi:MAG: hypothetical protein PHW18_04930 [Sulfuricurvum sp.]|uniref:hypothetical protein n=1 Tax=Sulfuricurvum sp. TaxID=2025608 RepID=UPI002637AA65|nr:hypothetical protein [Sulfuricurvum sp.]MDD2828900.1 hypothetical protein [Sulfuricurvum sp.]MDD4948563.1 hypothetical protein [Sulfuricurvum sp.]
MTIERDLSIYDDKILKNIQTYLTFNGDFKSFQEFLLVQDIELISDMSQFLIFYDDKKKIVHAKYIKLLSKQKKILNFGCNIFKWILYTPFFLKDTYNREKHGVTNQYETLNKENITNIFKIDETVKIILIEIPKDKKQAIRELKETLECFINIDNLKYEIYIKENLGSFTGTKILLTTYSSILVASILLILHTIPYSLINDSEILLSIKIFIAIFLSIFSIFAVITFLMIYADSKSKNSYSKHNLLSVLKKTAVLLLIIYATSSIIAGANNNKNRKIFPIQNMVADFYIDNKTSLVYDKYLQKPIIFLGIKDGVYYYYDIFQTNSLKDLNVTDEAEKSRQIKLLILNIYEENTTKLFQDTWKIEKLTNINFDYNNTLIIQKMLQ